MTSREEYIVNYGCGELAYVRTFSKREYIKAFGKEAWAAGNAREVHVVFEANGFATSWHVSQYGALAQASTTRTVVSIH